MEYDPDDGTLDFVVDDPPGLTEAEVDTRIDECLCGCRDKQHRDGDCGDI